MRRNRTACANCAKLEASLKKEREEWSKEKQELAGGKKRAEEEKANLVAVNQELAVTCAKHSAALADMEARLAKSYEERERVFARASEFERQAVVLSAENDTLKNVLPKFLRGVFTQEREVIYMKQKIEALVKENMMLKTKIQRLEPASPALPPLECDHETSVDRGFEACPRKSKVGEAKPVFRKSVLLKSRRRKTMDIK